ncbi:MAG: trimethylamine methyltransferase family protein [Pseudomonadota bacterium]
MRRSRTGGRRARRPDGANSDGGASGASPWGGLKGGLADPFVSRLPPYDILDEGGVEAIHETSMRLLETVGIDFRNDPETLALWAQAGAQVDGDNVKIDRNLALDLVAKAPETFVQHARNPARSVTFGKNHMVFAPVFASPNVWDLDGVRREARLADFHYFLKLTQMASSLNHGGAQICEPMDIAATRRHLEVIYGHLTYSDKPFLGDPRGGGRAQDSLRMCEIVFGRDVVEKNVVLLSLVTAASPLLWDATMLAQLRFYAANGQALIITPFVMQGANTPVTMAGALAQLNAEAIAGIALAQLVRPGTPVIYGVSLATASMKSGAPQYGTSEVARMTYVIGQLARRYKLPMRVGGGRNGAMLSDATAGAQNVMTMLPAIQAQANYIIHSAGWLESSMAASFAQFIIDLDQLAILQDFAQGIDVTDEALAFEAISQTKPGGDFFSSSHTLRHYKEIFVQPMIDTGGNYEAWRDAGSQDVTHKALKLARAALEAYEPPPTDPAIDAELRAYIERRNHELPDIET